MAQVAACLRSLSNGKIDEESSEYIAAMVDPSDQLMTPVGMLEVLGPFLFDARVIQSEQEGLDFCKQLLSKAFGVQSGLSQEESVLKDLRMEDPICLQDLINQYITKKGQNAQDMTGVDKGDLDGEDAALAEAAANAGGGFDDPFLGLQKTQNNFNSFIPIGESMKLAKAVAKKREKQLRMMRQWEKSKVPLPAPQKKHGDIQLRKLQDVIVPSFSVSVAGRELLKDASLRLVLGHRYGLIGRNGIGKTTFLSALVRGEIVGVDPDINVGCVEQEFPDSYQSLTPLELVLKVDEERESLKAEEKRLLKGPQTEEVGKRLTWLYARLQEIEADMAEPEAAQILSGLGLSQEMYREKKVKELSGGWRMRVMLARVLFADPDVLCLDEPTNHLDLHAVAWLTGYLRVSGKTCIIVSHARDFLNDVCSDIMEFRDRVS